MAAVVIERRFWSKVERGDGCWAWLAGKNREGYGQFSLAVDGRHRQLGAHVVAYWLAHGVWPGEMWVLHHCDNASCVRPDHLYLGTHADNVQDRELRGRTLSGETHGSIRFSDAIVTEVRNLYKTGRYTQAELARRFGTSSGWISLTVRGIGRKVAL